MGCGPSRATEASAYGVDAVGRVPDAPSAGRQTPACSRGEDACPQPEEPHPEGTQSDGKRLTPGDVFLYVIMSAVVVVLIALLVQELKYKI